MLIMINPSLRSRPFGLAGLAAVEEKEEEEEEEGEEGGTAALYERVELALSSGPFF